jgi:hypothetical protein
VVPTVIHCDTVVSTVIYRDTVEDHRATLPFTQESAECLLVQAVFARFRLYEAITMEQGICSKPIARGHVRRECLTHVLQVDRDFHNGGVDQDEG